MYNCFINRMRLHLNLEISHSIFTSFHLSLSLCCEAFYIGGGGAESVLSPPVPLSRSTPIPPIPPPRPPRRHLPRLRHFEDLVMSDESVEIETHAEGGQVEVHAEGQHEGQYHGCQMAIAGFLNCICVWPFGLEGLWLRSATLRCKIGSLPFHGFCPPPSSLA